MNPSERIDELIAELTDWRGKTFASTFQPPADAFRHISRPHARAADGIHRRTGHLHARRDFHRRMHDREGHDEG